jgi:hypothetical protein
VFLRGSVKKPKKLFTLPSPYLPIFTTLSPLTRIVNLAHYPYLPVPHSGYKSPAPCHPVTLSPCHPVTLSPCHRVHPVTLSPCLPLSPPPLPVSLSLTTGTEARHYRPPCSPCHPVTVSSCHLVTKSLPNLNRLTTDRQPTEPMYAVVSDKRTD